jgi:hypothetical protein
MWTFIKVSSSVLLGLNWGWKLEDDHFNECFGSINPLLEDIFHEMLSLESSLISLQADVESHQHFVDLIHLTVHGSSAKSDDWLHHELHESSLELLTIIVLVVVGTFLPFLAFSVVIVVTPKLGSHFFSVDTEFDAVHISEFGKSESPAEKSGTHGASTNLWINLEFLIHIFVFISGNDNIDVLNNSNEVLVHGFSINLELENGSVNFVDHKYWFNLFTESLSQDCLSLHSDTFNVVDDDESTIGYSESGGNFGREVDVTRGIDKVNQVTFGCLSWLLYIGLVIKRNTSGFDGNTSFLLVLSGVGSSGITSCRLGNNTGLGDQRIGQSTLAVIDMSND